MNISKHKRLFYLIAVFLTASPFILYANAGTPLIWFSLFHLAMGNLFIGVIEGSLLYKFYDSELPKSISIMILANYISWISGGYFISNLHEYIFSEFIPLYLMFEAWIISLVILFLYTVLIESVFVMWVFKKRKPYKKLLFKTAIINIITYVGMIIIYLSFGSATFFTNTDVNNNLKDRITSNLEFYFITTDGKSIKKYNFPNNDFSLVKKLDSSMINPTLRLNNNIDRNKVNLLLFNNKKVIAIVDSNFCFSKDTIYYSQIGNNNNIEPKVDFRSINNRKWKVDAGNWASEGLNIEFDKTKQNYSLAVPWMLWRISDVSIINENFIIFRINNKVVLMDIKSNEIAELFNASDYEIKRISEY